VRLFPSFVERDLITIEWLASGCCAVDSKCDVRSLLHPLGDNDSIQTIRELIAVSTAGESPFRKCLVYFETHSPEDTDAGWIGLITIGAKYRAAIFEELFVAGVARRYQIAINPKARVLGQVVKAKLVGVLRIARAWKFHFLEPLELRRNRFCESQVELVALLHQADLETTQARSKVKWKHIAWNGT
jgi:hypothetical protein